MQDADWRTGESAVVRGHSVPRFGNYPWSAICRSRLDKLTFEFLLNWIIFHFLTVPLS